MRCQGFIIYCYVGLNLLIYGAIHKLQGRYTKVFFYPIIRLLLKSIYPRSRTKTADPAEVHRAWFKFCL